MDATADFDSGLGKAVTATSFMLSHGDYRVRHIEARSKSFTI